MYKYVYIPKSIREEIKPLTRSYPKKIKIGVFDTETYSAKTGRAYLLTCYNGKEVEYFWIDDKDERELSFKLTESKKPEKKLKVSPIFFKFIDYLTKTFKGDHTTNLLYAHNLEFDLSAVLDTIYPELFMSGHNVSPEYTFAIDDKDMFSIKIYGHSSFWAIIKLGNNKRKITIKLIDTFNYIRSDLYSIGRNLNLPFLKPQRCAITANGDMPRNEEERTEVLEYTIPEIQATYAFAEWILDIHREFDIPISVSIADLSSKIFRKHFVKCPIPQIPRDSIKQLVYLDESGKEFLSPFDDEEGEKVMTKVKRYDEEKGKEIIEDAQRYIYVKSSMKLAELSYHGGRASSFIGKLCEVSGVNCYDYNSFYPYAMSKLPPLTSGEWKEVNEFDNEYEGFYEVTGTVKKCKYPIILYRCDNFDFAGLNKDERIIKAPLTSYETRESLRTNELSIEEIRGYVWMPDKDAVNPFKDFVEHFYKLKKESDSNPSKRWAYKIILNALYGKCIQTNPFPEYKNQPDVEVDVETGFITYLKKRYGAGSMYLPHVASWITSLCRAQLHRDMHKYNALTCSTDSIMTREVIKEGKELGELKLEKQNDLSCENGLLLFFRPKLYVYFPNKILKEIEEKGSLREYLRDVNLEDLIPYLKYALHGFRGTVKDLLIMYRDNTNAYMYKHFWKTKESIIQGKPEKLRVVESKEQRLNVDWTKEIMLCGLTAEKAIDEKELCIYPNCFNCANGKEI